MIVIRAGIIGMSVIVVKSNYRNSEALIGKTGVIASYNGDEKQNIRVEFPDKSSLWFDADELNEQPVRV